QRQELLVLEMSNEKALTVIEQKEVAFYSDQITAVLIEQADGNRVVYVPIRPICDLLGVARRAQQRRIQEDDVLSSVVVNVPVMSGIVTDPDLPSSSRPKTSHMMALPLDYLNGWLFGINAKRVKSEVRDQLIRYQKDCYRVLSEAFQSGTLSFDSRYSDLLKTDSPAAKAVLMAQAILEMAQRQLIAETRLDEHEKRLDSLEEWRGDNARHITPAQASRVSEAVKSIAFELGQSTGRNEYQGVYMQLYRRYGIPAYRELPASKFDDCMSWLRQWYESLTDKDAPF
ncbi:MAG: phage antirepressor N-terminal domain-containing protein, partial [Chloroflexota bacterium]